ncbi:hypothetical protein VTK73DRAFT_7568 [Phialemonium thermophilum]|uniref:Uncharacterized protein n=1 Tax=Phialemonium thermophilum TaxID=223376 RepID=A0ABR3WDQ4_9PEZI
MYDKADIHNDQEGHQLLEAEEGATGSWPGRLDSKSSRLAQLRLYAVLGLSALLLVGMALASYTHLTSKKLVCYEKRYFPSRARRSLGVQGRASSRARRGVGQRDGG